MIFTVMSPIGIMKNNFTFPTQLAKRIFTTELLKILCNSMRDLFAAQK